MKRSIYNTGTRFVIDGLKVFRLKDVSDFTTSQVSFVPDMHVDVVTAKEY